MYTIWRGPAHGPIAMPLPQFRRRPDASPADRPHRDAPPPPGRAAGLQRLPAPRRDPSRGGIPSRHAHGVAGRRRRGRGDDPGRVGRPRGLPPGRDAGRGGRRRRFLSARGGAAGDRAGAIARGAGGAAGRSRLGVGPGVAVPGRRRGPGLAGIAGGRSTTGPSGGCNWPPRRAGVWVCSCGRPSRGTTPSWADVRLLVQPQPAESHRRRLRIVLLRCRGSREGRGIQVELDDESHPLFTTAPESRDQCRRQCRA